MLSAVLADPVDVAVMLLIVEVLTRIGFWAPHGLSERQAPWQDESP